MSTLIKLSPRIIFFWPWCTRDKSDDDSGKGYRHIAAIGYYGAHGWFFNFDRVSQKLSYFSSFSRLFPTFLKFSKPSLLRPFFCTNNNPKIIHIQAFWRKSLKTVILNGLSPEERATLPATGDTISFSPDDITKQSKTDKEHRMNGRSLLILVLYLISEAATDDPTVTAAPGTPARWLIKLS